MSYERPQSSGIHPFCWLVLEIINPPPSLTSQRLSSSRTQCTRSAVSRDAANAEQDNAASTSVHFHPVWRSVCLPLHGACPTDTFWHNACSTLLERLALPSLWLSYDTACSKWQRWQRTARKHNELTPRFIWKQFRMVMNSDVSRRFCTPDYWQLSLFFELPVETFP